MAAATRIGDTTTGICDIGLEDCCPHGRTGTNDTGSSNVYVNGARAHRLGDGGGIACPHGGYFESVAASSTVFANGIGITRIGDATQCVNCGCPGNHADGSPNVFVGG